MNLCLRVAENAANVVSGKDDIGNIIFMTNRTIADTLTTYTTTQSNTVIVNQRGTGATQVLNAT